MNYVLISSERSPFGRICRLFMAHHKIRYDFRVLNFVDNKQDAEVLSQETPINKVPVLIVDEKQKIFDSRVIINYLAKKYKIKELSIDEENLVSSIYSCLDVSVTLFLMKMNGYDLSADNVYLRRQKERIPSNLDYIKSWSLKLDPQNPSDWNFASMSLYSFLYWADIRAGTIQLGHYPHFQSFLERFANAPGIKETQFSK